jgi:tetratricopeptide (TPR) repeat protein
MKRKRIFLSLTLLTAISLELSSQKLDKTAADSIYDHYQENRSGDMQANLKVLNELEDFLQASNDMCRLAGVLTWKGACYENLGQLDSAIAMDHIALQYFHPDCDSLILMSINANLTSTYLSFWRARTGR